MRTATTLLLMGLIAAPATHADNRHGQNDCSARDVAGKWVFATEVGHLTGLGSITALGTMNVKRNGELSGLFDATVLDTRFMPNNTYTGSLTIDRDCRGTLTFTDSTGRSRTDSIVVVSSAEIWGMSQNPGVLWTYRVRRIGWL